MAQVYGLAIQDRRVTEDASADLTSTSLAPGPIVRDTTLYMIDPETGQTTEIGITDSIICTGMDFHPRTGVLYAVCSTSQVPKGAEVNNKIFEDDTYLVRINPATGILRKSDLPESYRNSEVAKFLMSRSGRTGNCSYKWQQRKVSYLEGYP